MSLIDLLLESTLGRSRAPERLSVALFSAGKELPGSVGYKRFDVVKGAWRVRQSEAAVTTKFGPFAEGCEFDRAVLLNGEQVVDEMLFVEPQQVSRGTVFEYEPTFGFPRA